jgi:all-trans-retinol dehydrogenase (NAD+)
VVVNRVCSQLLTTGTGPNVQYFKCDITSPAAIGSAAADIRSALGQPTVLINNAGAARGKTILDSTEADVRLTFDVNTLSHYWLVKEFLPSMIANDHGMVVTIASMASYVTVAQMVDYAASKAAALSFHEGLTSELRTRYNAPKVRTVAVTIGHTKTPLFVGWAEENRFLVPSLEPETVAEAIVEVVLSGSSGQVVVPGIGNFYTGFRGWPHWMQYAVRDNGHRHMMNWSGRQVRMRMMNLAQTLT